MNTTTRIGASDYSITTVWGLVSQACAAPAPKVEEVKEAA
jgi:hypothetical protein